MNKIFLILAKTPAYVYLIFCYILWTGYKQSKTRTFFLPKLFLTPVVLFLFKIPTLFLTNSNSLKMFGTGILFGCFLAIFFYNSKKYSFEPGSYLVKVQGSLKPLFLLLCYFLLRFIFGYIQAINPSFYSEISYFNLLFQGGITGYFLGEAAMIVKNFYDQ